MRAGLIKLYTTRLNAITDKDTYVKNSLGMEDTYRVKGITNMLKFLNTVSDKEIVKLCAVIIKFAEYQYISSFELKFIQTRFYHLIKSNDISDDILHIVFLFGFAKEVRKGYRYVTKEKATSVRTIYSVKDDDKDFQDDILKFLLNHTDDIIHITNKLIKRSVDKFGNASMFTIETNKNCKVPFFYPKDRKEAMYYVMGSTTLFQYPSRKNSGELGGRTYNKYWNKLKKIDKIRILPDYVSYDINTSIYQFLLVKAIELNLPYTLIKHYIVHKTEVRLRFSKQELNSLPYKIEKGYSNSRNPYIIGLSKEISSIISTLKDNGLFYFYERWERKEINKFIENNKLKSYIVNHDEILVHKREEINYIPSIFSIETIEERLKIVDDELETSFAQFKENRDKKIREEERRTTIIWYNGVLKRTKDPFKRRVYFYKIESLKVCYDENFLGKEEDKLREMLGLEPIYG